jgi:hypothetical protein
MLLASLRLHACGANHCGIATLVHGMEIQFRLVADVAVVDCVADAVDSLHHVNLHYLTLTFPM